MAERTPPSYLQNAGATHTAENTRLAQGSPLLSSGVVNPTDLAVTAPGGVMQVSVAAGQGWLVGSRTNQGAYHVINDAPKTVTIAASDASNPRYDRIVAEVKDSQYSGATNSFVISVVQGTPSSSPAEPAIPADSFELARILVPAASTSVTSGNILDRRTRAIRRGAVYSPAAASDPGLVVKGLPGQAGDLLQWQNSTGTVLGRVASNGVIYAPTISAGDVGTVATSTFFTVASATPSFTPIVARGASLQTANLQEWQNSGGTPLALVSASGAIAAAGLSSSTPVKVANTSASSGGTTSPGVTLADQTDASSALHSSEVVIGQITQRIHFDTQDSSRIVWKHVYSRDGFTASQIVVEMTDEVGGRYARAIFGNKTNTPALVVRGNPSHSAALQEWQNSSGTVLAYVNNQGNVYAQMPGVGLRLLEIGAADSAGTGYRAVRVLN